MPAAYAHTDAELDAWTGDWAQQVWATGEVDWPLWMQYGDMEVRHPRYFGRPVPHAHPARNTARPTPRAYTAGVEQWRPLVETYFAADQVERAMRIMACESGGDPNVMHDYSDPASASGLMQHLGKYWSSRSAAAGWAGASIFDPEANIAVAAWLQRTGGWSHWVCR